MAYTPRFRHRNSLYTGGNSLWEIYNSNVCGEPQFWAPYSGGTPTRKLGRVEHMDDVTGDPPYKKAGVNGFKFHTMSKTRCEISGVGYGSWSAIAKGESCKGTQNEFYVQWRSNHASGYDQNVSWSGYDHKMIGDRLNLELYPVPWNDLEISKDIAATQALSKRGRTGESNLFESLAEIGKATRTFSDVLDRARRIQDTLFFGAGAGKSRRRALTEEIAGQRLMTDYGWKPLVKDVIGILDSLEKTTGVRVVSSRGEHKQQRTTTLALPAVEDAGVVRRSRTQTTLEEWTARAVSVDQFFVSAMHNLGLSGKDLLLTPWELLAYSHVADWFLNVGDFLGSLVQDPRLLNIGQVVSIRYIRSDTMTFASLGQVPANAQVAWVLSDIPPPPVTRRLEYYSRDVGALAPSLRLRPDSLNLNQAINGLAMFTVATAKVRQKFVPTPKKRGSIGRYVDELPRGAWRDYHWAK